MNKIVKILSWVFLVIFVIVGLSLVSKSILSSLFSILLAVLLFPKTKDFVQKKYSYTLNGKIKAGIIVILLIGIGIAMPKSDVPTPSSDGPSKQPTQTAPITEKQIPVKEVTQDTLPPLVNSDEEKITDAINTSLGSKTNTDKQRVVSVEIKKYDTKMLSIYKYKSGESVMGILIKINADENLTTNLQKGTMHNEATKVAKAVFPINQTIGDIIIWSQLPVKDQYGNIKDDKAIIYSISRSLFDKINWSNFYHRDLPTLLKSENNADDRNNYIERIKF